MCPLFKILFKRRYICPRIMEEGWGWGWGTVARELVLIYQLNIDGRSYYTAILHLIQL